MLLNLGGFTFGLREGVLLLVALVAVYMLVVLWRMRRVTPSPAATSAPAARPLTPAGAPPEPPASDLVDVAAERAWGRSSQEMAEGVLRRGLEQEVTQLRDEVDALRGELAALRSDLQQEVAHLRAAQTVSPIYGDAMQLAAAGYDPAAIAERCGIARAEAELVVALARSQDR